jgi:hypothetical protein
LYRVRPGKRCGKRKNDLERERKRSAAIIPQREKALKTKADSHYAGELCVTGQ